MKLFSLIFLACLLAVAPTAVLAACSPGQVKPPCDPSVLSLSPACVTRAVQKCKGDQACLDRELVLCSIEVARQCLEAQGAAGHAS